MYITDDMNMVSAIANLTVDEDHASKATTPRNVIPMIRPLLADVHRQESFASVTSDVSIVSDLSEYTVSRLKTADKALQTTISGELKRPLNELAHIVDKPISSLDEATIVAEVTAAATKNLFNFECAFGFTGSIFNVEPLTEIPREKKAFVAAIRTEITAIGFIQDGLTSYMREINSRKYHKFSVKFLLHQNRATVITIDQLDKIILHLEAILEEVENLGSRSTSSASSSSSSSSTSSSDNNSENSESEDDGHKHGKQTNKHKIGNKAHDEDSATDESGQEEEEQQHIDEILVDQRLIEAYEHAKPWILRTRAILQESHVFYKINYVLGADTKGSH